MRTTVNACAGLFVYASPAYVRRFGWHQQLVNESYAWVQPVVASFPVVKQWQNAFRAGLLEAGISPYNAYGYTYEHIAGMKVGGTLFDENGIRHTAADLLQYADSTRLVVHTGATVERILLHPAGVTGLGRPSAYGVTYIDALGIEHTATLRDEGKGSEVILAAGALGSPQLLMLSGIGPRSKLEPFGIDVEVPLEGVGEGMAHNPTNAMFVPSPSPVENSSVHIVGITPYNSFIKATSGNGTSMGQGSLSTVAPSNRTLGLLQQFNARLQSLSNTIRTQLSQGGILLQKVSGPLSTGYRWLRLRSCTDQNNRIVRFNNYQDPGDHDVDLQVSIDGVSLMDRVIRSPALKSFRNKLSVDLPAGPLRAFSYLISYLPRAPRFINQRLGQWCRDTAAVTIWHYHGGCGSRVDAVINEKTHRVIGVGALQSLIVRLGASHQEQTLKRLS